MSSLATSVSTSEPEPESNRRRVLVIDADLLIAEAVTSALGRMTFAARFAMPVNSAHLRDLAAWRPGLALLNVDTVEPAVCVSSVALLRADNLPVVLLTSRSDLAVVAECVAAGASAVVDRGCSLDELVQMVTQLIDGHAGGDQAAGRPILDPLPRQTGDERGDLTAFDVLTQREKCVLAELMDGAEPDAIARRSSTSVGVVRSQVKSILQKLGVNSQLAAVSLARRSGWMPDGAPAAVGRDRPPPSTPERLGQSA